MMDPWPSPLGLRHGVQDEVVNRLGDGHVELWHFLARNLNGRIARVNDVSHLVWDGIYNREIV